MKTRSPVNFDLSAEQRTHLLFAISEAITTQGRLVVNYIAHLCLEFRIVHETFLIINLILNNGIARHKHVETDDDLHPRLNRGGKVSEVRRMRLSLLAGQFYLEPNKTGTWLKTPQVQ